MATLSLSQLPAACALVASLAPACAGGEPVVQGPLVVERPLQEFGVSWEGALLEHEWEVRVTQPLAIEEAKTDCGCTVARLEREAPGGALLAYELGTPLEAGENVHVTVRFDTRGRPGPSRRAVTLRTSLGGLLPLTVSTEVRPWLQMEPTRIDFERVLEGVGARCALEIASEGGQPFALRASGTGLPEWVTVEVRAHEPGADGRASRWSVEGVLAPSAPRGTYSYPLELVSDVEIPGTAAAGLPRSYSVSPPWTLQIVGPVALSSPNLEFGIVRPEETVSKSLRLESYDPEFVPAGATARLEPIHAEDPFPLGNTAQVRVHPEGRACDVEVVLAGLDPAVTGTFMAKLVVETGHPALPRLEAFVRGVSVPRPEAR